MADNDIATLGIAVDTAGLLAGDAAMAKMAGTAAILEKQASAAEAALSRMSALSEKAFAKVSPAMAGLAGPSAAGGSMAGGATQTLTALEKGATAADAALARLMGTSADATRGYSAHAVGVAAVGQALDGFTAATKRGTVSVADQVAALGHGTAAHKSHGAAAYGNTLQMMELAHVSRALFDEYMAGGSIVRGLAMEFGRLQIAVSAGEGGITGMLGRVAGFAGRLANPLALATGGVLALGAASAYGFSQFEEGQDRLERSLNGRGRLSGATLGDLQGVAARGAAAGRLSIGDATDLTARYTAAGLAPNLTGSLVDLTRDYGRVTGLGTDKGGAALEKAFADPVKGLGELDRSLGFVDDRLRQQVADLERSGHLEDAQAVALRGLKTALDGAKDSTWAFSRGLNSAENWFADRFHQAGAAVAGAFGLNSAADKLAEMQRRAANLERVDPVGSADYIAELRREMLPLMASVTADQQKATADKRDAEAVALSGRAGDAVRQILPEVMRQRSAADTIELLRSTLADPMVLSHLDASISPAMVGRAYSQASVMETMSRPGVRERQDYDLSLSRIRDSGVQDQGLNVARRAELDVLRETGDVMRATTAAQRSYNLELARAQESADDLARKAHQDLDLVGLSPYDRARKQLDQEYLGPRGLIENYRLDKGGADVMSDKDIRGDLSGGFKILTAAQDAAGSITAAGGHLVGAVEGVAAKLDAVAGRISPAETAARSPYGALDRTAFAPNGAPLPFFAAGGRAFDLAPANVQAMISDASARTGMPAGVIAAIGQRENGYRLTGGTNIKGPDGRPASTAYGFGQLTDGAAADVAHLFPGFSKYDPSTAVLGSAVYLRILQGRFGDLQTALDHYGTGPGYGADILRRSGGALAAAPTSAGTSTLAIAARDAGTAPIPYTGEASARAAYADKRSALDKSFTNADPGAFGTPLGEAERRMKEQNAVLDLQASSFGKLDTASRGAIAGQQLWAQYVDSGAEKTLRLADATGTLADRVRSYGVEAAAQSKRAEDQAAGQQSIIDTADTLRGGATSVLSGGILSAAHGQKFGKGARTAAEAFGDQLINRGVTGLMGGLLGGQGSPFGGLLGGLFSGLSLPHFAGGTGSDGGPGGLVRVGESGPETIVMPAHAQVLTAAQTSSMMASRGSAAPQLPPIAVHIHPVGGAQFTPDQVTAIRGQVSQGVADGHAELMRNWSQFQLDAGQTQ